MDALPTSSSASPPRASARSLVVAAGWAVLAVVGIFLLGAVVLAMGRAGGILGQTPESHHRQATWTVLAAISGGVTLFCRRVDTREQSVLFGRWSVELRWYGFALLAAVIIQTIGIVLAPWRERPETPGQVLEFFLRSGRSADSAVLAFAYFALVIPVVEEVLFRRGIFAALRRFPTWVPFVVSVLLFTVAHATDQRGAPFLVGVATAFLYVRTGSLLPSVTCHGVANAIGVALTLLVPT